MKILLVTTLLEPFNVGGAEISVMNLAKRFASNGHQVKVITLKHPLRDDSIRHGTENLEIIDLKPYPFSLFRTNKFFPSSKILWHILDSIGLSHHSRIKKVLKEFRPDVIHTNNLTGIGTFIWREAKRNGIPTVHTTRDFFLLCLRSTMFKENENCLTQCKKCYFFRRRFLIDSQIVSTVVGISDSILQEHLRYGYFAFSNSNRVIHNSFSPEKIIDQNSELIGTKKNIQEVNFLFVGQLIPEKGIEFLLNIFREGPFEGEFLFIAGTGAKEYVQHLKDLAAPNPNIVFLGRIDINEINSRIDYLLVPSLWREPFGRVVFDAISLNSKIVASDTPGLVEAVKLTPMPYAILETSNYLNWKNLIVSLSKGQELNLFYEPEVSSNESRSDFLEYESLFTKIQIQNLN